jgi:hypothetical protein
VVANKTGLLVPPGDAPALARAIISLLEHAEWAIQLGERGAVRAAHAFSVDAMLDSMVAVYSDVVSSSTATPCDPRRKRPTIAGLAETDAACRKFRL